MKISTAARGLAAALVGLSLTAAPKFALADIKDYEFQLVEPTVQAGPEKVVTVRLLNKKTSKPVSDAVIFKTRVDMAPDGMAEMESAVAPLPSNEPGVYAFKTDLPMAGRYQVTLSAKVQGEPETVTGKVVVTATK